MVLREAVALTTAGAATGIALAWVLSRFVAAALFQVQPHDGRVYTASIAILIVVGLAAALVPAIRASRTDPVVAMRN
jgi:ABC-type antimicrobial peptide transport system permease subunit